MNYRVASIFSPEDLGASGTKIINLNGIKEPISRIEIRFKTTKVLYQMTAPGPGNITKIELVTGSTPLHSLTGYGNQALAYYSKQNISMEHGQHIPTLAEVDIYHLDFGRYLWDPQLAFLAEKYNNPQLKITWDEDVADTSCTTNEMEVWAHLFDDRKISPIGFLSALEHWSDTLKAENSYHTIELPDDFPYRQLLVRGYRDGFEPWVQIKEARFDENELAKIPWEFTDLEYYYRLQKAVNPPIRTPLIVEPTSSERVYYIPATDYWATAVFTNVSANQDIYINAASGKGGKLPLIATGNAQAVGIASGYLPWHHYQFPFGLQNDIADWYDPKGKSPRLRLRVGSSGTNGTGSVVLEQLRRYS